VETPDVDADHLNIDGWAAQKDLSTAWSTCDTKLTGPSRLLPFLTGAPGCTSIHTPTVKDNDLLRTFLLLLISGNSHFSGFQNEALQVRVM
jgi:hypothetical protein